MSDNACPGGWIGDVELKRVSLAALARNSFGDVLRPLLRYIRDDDDGTFGGKSRRNGGADAPATAGHQRDPFGELARHYSRPTSRR